MAGEIALNFVDADIHEVARTILGDLLKVNYVIDPKVQGKITLQTSRPLPESALVSILETALAMNGAALTLVGDVYEIVPLAQAPLSAGTPRITRSADAARKGFSLSVVPLDYVAATEMERILAPIAPVGAIVRADDARNLLIIAADGRALEPLLETIDMFDVDWLAGMSFGYFPVRFADAKTLADELTTILTEDDQSPVGKLLRFIPIERLNTILVVSPQPRYLDYAEEWIDRLDQEGDEGQQRLYVYFVQNRDATELADVLNQLFTGAGSAGGTEGTLAPHLQPVVRRSTVPESGADPESVPPTSSIPRQMRSGYVPSSGPRESGGGDAAATQGDVRIMADKSNNALLILATLSDYRIVLGALERLDLVPLQVLIEATIAEVTLNDELSYGVQWFLEQGDSTASFSALETGVIASAFPGFSYFFNSSNVKVVLNALAAVTDVRVISSPQIMVLDNKTATLQVGDQVPIATQSAVGVTNPDSPIVNEIQFFDTGVILSVTPRVNAGGLVLMDIEQEVSNAVPTLTSGIDSPTIQQRKIVSSVAIQSGETVALGGLIKDSNTTSDTGIPILKDIPILGHLFGVTSKDDDRTELLILITPTVIRDRDEARQVTNELRQRMRTVVPLAREIE